MEALDCINYHNYRIEVVADGDAIGYQIYDPEGVTVEHCYGLYDPDCLMQLNGWALQECCDIVDGDIAAWTSSAVTV